MTQNLRDQENHKKKVGNKMLTIKAVIRFV
jgi:hypothetical protein